MSNVIVEFDPLPLVAKVHASFDAALEEDVIVARAKCTWRHVAASIVGTPVGSLNAVLAATSPDAAFLESGTSAHEETPHNQAMKLANGDFVRGTVPHPGTDPHPFLRPAGMLFPELYGRSLGRALA